MIRKGEEILVRSVGMEAASGQAKEPSTERNVTGVGGFQAAWDYSAWN